jgi:ABC-type transport system substrate-binding protein/streptogramin lyase
MRSEVPTGTVLGGFRVESLIGEGAMGAVYLAESPDGRPVALKLLSPELARDERFRQRFLRESQLAAGLDHPRIVPTLASGEADGVLYLATAYIDGSDLRELLRREGRLEPERALQLLAQVADALDAAHAAGLVHRDVKPGNILVKERAEGEQAYICDFGLARHMTSVSSLTGERGFVGTIDYVPPEQIEGGQIDSRADVYSLGCVLFECLAGVRPFDRESELSVIFAHLNAPTPRLTDVRPELPEAFDEVFQTALAKAPDDRYASCSELVAAARAALRGQAVGRRQTSRRLLAGVALVAAAAAAISGLLVTRGGHRSPEPVANQAVLSLEPDGLNLIDAKTRKVVGRTGFGRTVWDIAFAGGSAWVLLGDEERIARVDLASHRVERILKIPGGHGARLAAGGGAIWVTENTGRGVVRIDSQTGRVALPLHVSGGAGEGIAYGAGSLWLARGSDVARVDPRNGRVLQTFPVGGAATWVVFGDGTVWAASSGNGVVTKIDPVENRITARQKLHGWISDLAVGGGFVWVPIVPDGTVFKLNEADLSVQASLTSGPGPERISFGGGILWIASTGAKTVSLLEPGSGTRRELAASVAPNLALYHDGLVWTGAVPVPQPLAPIHGQELRISMPHGFLGADPSTSPGLLNEQLFYATCANLLNYADSAGVVGTRLRPEIAVAMPTVSSDGRTYTFRIRPGFRFSPPSPDRPAALRQPLNAVPEVVTAETFRHTIERALSPKLGAQAPAVPFASDIVGVAAYRAGKAAHIGGIVARGNVLSIRLVRPSGDFLTRISMHFFCPVPIREPVVPSGLTGAIPSAGPYYVALIEGNRTVLRRSPNYRGRRPQRVERIVYTQGVPTPTAIAQVAAGDVDYLPADFDPYSLLAPGGTLDQRYGANSPAARRYFLQPYPGVGEIVFNTHRLLFRDLRLRRAVNYALDRPSLAAVWGQRPADHYIPPAVPGYRPGHIYPIDGPDLRMAQRLAGGRKRRAVLYFCGHPANGRVAEIVRSNLARIAIGVSIVESQGCLRGDDPKAAKADLLLGGRGTPERDPAPFIQGALESGTYGVALGPGPWQDRGLQRRLEQANALNGKARFAAYARLDAELARDAVPFAAFSSWTHPDYFSAGVGCKVFQSAYHFVDLGALCLRKP